MKKPIYQWNGQYWGFIYRDRLFDDSSIYVGWVDQKMQVWKHDGTYLGELVQDRYVLRKLNKTEPTPKSPKFPPSSPYPPFPKTNKSPKTPKSGWVDPLEDLEY